MSQQTESKRKTQTYLEVGTVMWENIKTKFQNRNNIISRPWKVCKMFINCIFAYLRKFYQMHMQI